MQNRNLVPDIGMSYLGTKMQNRNFVPDAPGVEDLVFMALIVNS